MVAEWTDWAGESPSVKDMQGISLAVSLTDMRYPGGQCLSFF